MNILNEIEGILEENKPKGRKPRKLLVREKRAIEDVHPLFKHKFPDITDLDNLEEFLEWAKEKNFSKKELQIIKMSRETTLPNHYKTVWTREDLSELVQWLSTLDIVAVDTETTGVDKYKDSIVGMSFYAPHQGYYIPMAHIDDINTSEEARAEFDGGGGYEALELGVDYVECLPMGLIRSEVSRELMRSGLKQVYHNFGFDYHIIRRYLGVKVECYYDTIVGQALLDENHPKGLKDMATTYLGVPADNYSTMFGNITFDRVPILINRSTGTGNIATYYATKDTELTYNMYEFQIKHLNTAPLKDLRDIMFDIEMPFIHMVVDTEELGVKLDSDYLINEVKPKLEEELEEMRRQIFDVIGDINLNSPKQLSEALYDDLKLPVVNSKRPRSTDRATMTRLSEHHSIIDVIMEYRKKNKLKDTFVDKLPGQVIDGRVHTNFSTIKKTGRMSSSSPNLQQIPSYTNLIRNAFVADEGRLLASVDFGSQELRILTEISGDEVMFDIFTSGGDAHSTTAVTIWNNKHPKEPVDIDTYQRLRKVSDSFRDRDGEILEELLHDQDHLKELKRQGVINTEDRDVLVKEANLGAEFESMRDKAKTVNFSIVYGTTSMGLSDNLEISTDEAEMYIASYMETYPGVAQWMKDTQKQIREKSYVTTMLGRKRRFHREVSSGQRWLLESAYRQGSNYQIQGSAAEMTKKAALDLRPILKKYGVNILLYVHDEIIFDIPEDLGMEPLQEIADVMCNAVPLKCGMTSDIDVSRRWGQRMNQDDLNELFD